MEDLIKKYKEGGGLHHAYIVVGEQREALTKIEEIACAVFDVKKDSLTANPDFLISQANVFGINEGRILKEQQKTGPVMGCKRIFVCNLNFITREAQNALLKTLEEPAEDNYFFFTSSTIDIFLPTLLSRVEVIELPIRRGVAKEEGELFWEFLGADTKERLHILDDIKDKDNEEFKLRLMNFFDGLERIVATISIEKMTDKEATVPGIIWRAKKDLGLRGSLPRLVVENVAISLPKIGVR